jgi:hypothetical protein
VAQGITGLYKQPLNGNAAGHSFCYNNISNFMRIHLGGACHERREHQGFCG